MAIIPKGGGGKPEEEKTVTAGTSAKVVTPSDGKTIKNVTVNPTPSQSKTVTPSTSQQTVSPDSGKLLSQVIIKAMPSGALSDITVSSAGLITAQVGTSGYLASGTKKTKQLTTQAAKTWTPGKSDQTISSGRYLTGKQTIKGDADLIAENIRKGIDIFGVLGTMAEGIAFEDISRFTKVAVDTFTFASDQNLGSNITLTHSLGVKPEVVLLFSKTKPDIRNCIVEMLQSAVGTYAYEELNRVTTHVSTGAFMLETTQVVASTSWIPTSSLVKLPDESGYFLGAGLEYTLITMA